MRSTASPGAPRRLEGADVFARLLDREIRGAGLPGFHSHALLHLDGRPDLERLRAAVAAGTPLGRGLRSVLRRTFPLGAPRWESREGTAPPRVDEWPEAPPGLPLLAVRLRPDRGENVRFAAFPVPGDGWRLAFLFHHLLLDAKGAERLLVRLSAGEGEAAWAEPRTLAAGLPFGRRMEMLRGHNRFLEGLGGGRVHIAATAADGPARSFEGRTVLLDPAASARAVAAGRKAAGYAMEGIWYLASLLAADRATDPRPAREGARYVIALPTSLDRKGETLRVFGNHLSFQFVGVPVAGAADAAATARALRDGLLAGLRDGALRNGEVQMDLCRRLPLFLYSRLARGTMGGAFASLFFTNPGPVEPGLERFFGAGVRELHHFPVPTPVPGLCAVTWRFRDRLGLGVTWVDGRVPGARAEALLDRWKRNVAP